MSGTIYFVSKNQSKQEEAIVEDGVLVLLVFGLIAWAVMMVLRSLVLWYWRVNHAIERLDLIVENSGRIAQAIENVERHTMLTAEINRDLLSIQRKQLPQPGGHISERRNVLS